jgi:hypothetical protein
VDAPIHRTTEIVLNRRSLRALLLALVAIIVALPALWPAAPAAAAPADSDQRPPLPIIAFRFEDEPSRLAANECAAAWTENAPRLAAAIGLLPPGTVGATPPDTLSCLVMGSEAFSRLFAGRLPDWGVGVALPGGRVVAIDQARLPAVGRGVREVFLHEMVHALLMRASGHTPLPAWLHEGLAMRLSGEWRFSDTVTLAMEGRVPDLSNLRASFPGSAERAARAYLTSELAVGRLLDEQGPDIAARLMEATRRTRDFREAYEDVTGAPLEVFENDFAAAMSLRFGWLVLVTRWPTLFVLLALVLAVAAIGRVARSRRRLAAMPDEDDEPDPGYDWSGDPDTTEDAADTSPTRGMPPGP